MNNIYSKEKTLTVNFHERDFDEWFRSFHGKRREHTPLRGGFKKRTDLSHDEVEQLNKDYRVMTPEGGTSPEERRHALAEHMKTQWESPSERFFQTDREALPHLLEDQGYIVKEIEKQEGWGKTFWRYYAVQGNSTEHATVNIRLDVVPIGAHDLGKRMFADYFPTQKIKYPDGSSMDRVIGLFDYEVRDRLEGCLDFFETSPDGMILFGLKGFYYPKSLKIVGSATKDYAPVLDQTFENISSLVEGLDMELEVY